MADAARLVGALESFDRWHAPWTFIQAVRADHWMSARTLDAGAAAAEHALSPRFAWLSPLACRHLARAASYAWR
ncbi:hypothetical protein [Xanthomonas citri]|uniref:hypothetical protein n=1 Tax=Xanthomonas citri TaxID=346 RepID=UPI0002FF1B46|nr:hypothetical protein [Xanthomonas citri]RTE56250.1 hypothetical protein EI541_19650 [Xanthomonas axonopodis pv. eucalyptorum]AMV00527.1 hypothetical protein TP37_22365 [Xanthomonas citri pv. aurantifolii]AMV04844.1 hypothetical protein TP50_22175 [Xanthomonas citri pv. aurantifolii]AMV06871.1 hypothetical protein AC028_08680 [Xanthomonas citri pv. aurantifolii]ARE55245.1 hypothetical protein TP45_02015 [Xanthomonas citri pv. aurantifolii]